MKPNYSTLLGIIFLLLVQHFSCFGQNDTNKSNQIINGKKEGYWEHRDKKNRVIAAGYYKNGKKDRKWKFYLSSINRHLKKPDIVGTYKNGEKNGKWTFTEILSKVSINWFF